MFANFLRMLSRRWRGLGLALLAVIISLAAYSLWSYFGASGLRDFSDQAVVFDNTSLALPSQLAGANGRVRIVHFWDPACTSCNKETSAHLNYLIEMYRRQGVDFYSVQKPGTQGELAPFLQGKLIPLSGIEGMARLPASPAVAIWDRQGKLSYAGPYSPGLVCSSANSFVEPIIDQLVANKKINPIGMLAVGCYCPWSQ